MRSAVPNPRRRIGSALRQLGPLGKRRRRKSLRPLRRIGAGAPASGPLPRASKRTAIAAIAIVAVEALGAGCAPSESGPPPNVLLVTLDTTRVDHLGCYGYRRRTSPYLDLLADESIRYTRALSTSSWTLPSHASLFTGKFPASHGARLDPEGPLLLREAIKAPAEIRARGLSPGEKTLARLLGEAGYDTGAVVGGPWLMRLFGLSEGFDFYDDRDITSHAGRRADAITDAALRWLATPRDAPFFLFLNYFDPHFPYRAPEPYARTFLRPGAEPDSSRPRQFEALYDAEIFYMDEQLGRLLDFLHEEGLYEKTLIVVTSDHGELFGEHDAWGHRRFLYEELMRVPLLVKPPGPPSRGRTDDTRVQILDLFALILEHAGIPVPEAAQAQRPAAIRHPILAEVNVVDPAAVDGNWQALWDGPFKILRSGSGRRLLFDLREDPSEQSNLLEGDPARAREAMAKLDRAFATLPPPPPAAGSELEVDAKTREALQELGYVP